MARVDDYVNAGNIARKTLSSASFNDILACSGFRADGASHFLAPFLNRCFRVGYPNFNFIDQARPDAEIPLQEQVLILHYLCALKTITPKGLWIAYREIPGASFYFSAFVKRAIDPLKTVFGNRTEPFKEAAARLNGVPISIGDAGFEFQVFPKVPLRIILYAGDEEFEPEANILFDNTVGEFLSPEDAAWLAGMVVYRLAALGR